ncbi:cryptochrome/photolyase family protein [Aestuariibacter salexigens]|uniref:cryptochrome/photolyase family protein n=1 Tax=Aestuariibacter salexigens TaxID=226010 RepID=UPI000418563E|nr:cryptochrome/photolyase family protein [Aestuariibacter salexigens]
MTALRLILGDQLSGKMTSLSDLDKDNDVVLMAEVREEATYVKHHKKKIAFIFSAMRHFAERLRQKGIEVVYIKYDDDDNQGSLFEEVKRLASQRKVDRVIVTKPGEYRLLADMQKWQENLNVEVVLREDERFIASTKDFAEWAKGKKQLRMEFFYREMRKRTGILMEGSQPVGGKWNYDSENRKPLPKGGVDVPAPTRLECDDITKQVIELVDTCFSDHFGSLEQFHYAVDRDGALEVLKAFLEQRLANFGTYQDAMKQDEAWLFHSHIGLYLNTGLLLPDEVVKAAEQCYESGKAPLNAVEGFIRQILGWREYVRGLYWLKMPEYKRLNHLQATRRLPEFFWSADTDMNCLKQCISETRANAYAHHIQRLMVLGNFSLIAGLLPDDVNEWYLIVYADAYEWVELPNVSGMVLYADGGMLASKPYAASGAYINKMSDYCKSCQYSVTTKTGDKACPFNYLYWDFLIRNRDTLSNNHRMGMIYNTLDKMTNDKVEAITSSARSFFDKLDSNEKV